MNLTKKIKICPLTCAFWSSCWRRARSADSVSRRSAAMLAALCSSASATLSSFICERHGAVGRRPLVSKEVRARNWPTRPLRYADCVLGCLWAADGRTDCASRRGGPCMAKRSSAENTTGSMMESCWPPANRSSSSRARPRRPRARPTLQKTCRRAVTQVGHARVNFSSTHCIFCFRLIVLSS